MEARFEKRVERGEKLAEHLLSHMGSYHDHKETMAHAAVLVLLGFSGGILSLSQWPPSWVPALCISPRCVVFLGFLLVWALIHVYIRWQLRNRRDAAIICGGVLRAMGQWVQRDPTPEDLAAYGPSTDPVSCSASIYTFVDRYIFPCRRGTLHGDVPSECYPAWVRRAVDQQQGTAAIEGEVIVTLASFLALFVVFLRTVWN